MFKMSREAFRQFTDSVEKLNRTTQLNEQGDQWTSASSCESREPNQTHKQQQIQQARVRELEKQQRQQLQETSSQVTCQEFIRIFDELAPPNISEFVCLVIQYQKLARWMLKYEGFTRQQCAIGDTVEELVMLKKQIEQFNALRCNDQEEIQALKRQVSDREIQSGHPTSPVPRIEGFERTADSRGRAKRY